ncbi:hypothetical protein MMC07_002914 [Pseudocyphellaria aurata]|nr:hypothetical protein [Pseudocyphellaria aurata]
MTGGLSSILQPLSSDVVSRKPPDESHHREGDLVNFTPASQPAAAVYASSPRSVSPTAVTHSTNSRDSEGNTASASAPRHNRLSLAVAREKTTAALATLSLRSKPSSHSLHSTSSGSLSKQAVASASLGEPILPYPLNTTTTTAAVSDHADIPVESTSPRSSDIDSPHDRSTLTSSSTLVAPSAAPADEPPFLPAPIYGSQNKMHQTSSRLLRMTDEERPFTRDFEDLFSTLMVSLPLTAHRIRFQKVEHTFTSEEAINNLGSLKFSQSNRMPDPKDPTRIVTTTTTTTFSMAKEMARSVCQRFMDARFIEAADGKPVPLFPLKNAVWQLTPKGIHVLTRFCQRNGIQQRHVLELLDSLRNTMQLVILERDGVTDRLSHDRTTIEVIFRRFIGQQGPNIKNSIATSDSDSLSDYYDGLIGVKIAKERKLADRVVQNTFTGKAAVDWLMDCCTTVDRREVHEVAGLFVYFNLIESAEEDRAYMRQNPGASRFQPTKSAIYQLTERGQRIAGWLAGEDTTSSDDTWGEASKGAKVRKDGRNQPRDSNNHRLTLIVNDAAMRLLFREFLRDTHCEENLAFYLEVREFTRSYDTAERNRAFARPDAIRENLAAAYGLYNAFLAPGSPCELNIDHNLRNNLAGRMTRAVGDDDSMLKSLQEVVSLFRDAQSSVFKLMSSDSVPKFMKETKYAIMLSQHNIENPPPANHAGASTALPERSKSKAVRDARVS